MCTQLEAFNYLESLPGIETNETWLTAAAGWLLITLNPYQGLKLV